jgi:phosphoribosyl-ATP pyrophosphohydrolase/phosphoribosyl-AMP cyclohydrolase
MQAYMNAEALQVTLYTGRVTFWSRRRDELWSKGETSGNTLELVDVFTDCDGDCLLVTARPAGPACHRGTDSCFDGDGNRAMPELAFLAQLERVIRQRSEDSPEGSYTARLLKAGDKRIAQKVGEEGVETALAAVAGDDGELLEESADLLYHLLVLLRSRNLELATLVEVLKARHAV